MDELEQQGNPCSARTEAGLHFVVADWFEDFYFFSDFYVSKFVF